MLIGITGTDGSGKVNEEMSGSDYSEFMSRFALPRANRWTRL